MKSEYNPKRNLMPHTNSAKKRLRQSERRRLANRSVIKDIRLQMKKLATLAASGPIDQLRSECIAAVKKLDKAASRRVVHPNLAARKKSQIDRLLNAKAAGATKG
jgi:small subunit ribosomal protein S20